MAKNEGQEHEKIKSMAGAWLEEQGFVIEYEYRINNGRMQRNRKIYYTIDVYGKRSDNTIAVECGGSKINKLNDLLTIIGSVYVWPYGETSPFKWEEGLSVCPACGHITNIRP